MRSKVCRFFVGVMFCCWIDIFSFSRVHVIEIFWGASQRSLACNGVIGEDTAERRERAQDKPHPVELLWFYVLHLASVLAHLCQNGLFHQEESVSIGQQQKK